MIKNIAVQIVGQIRERWDEIYDHWLSVKDNAPAGMDIDFFLSSWKCDEYKDPNSLFIKSHIEDEDKFKYNVGILYYYNRMKKGSLLRKDYEIESNKKYDFVFQIRPDAFIGNFWEWIDSVNETLNRDPNTSYINNHRLISNKELTTHKVRVEGSGLFHPQGKFYLFMDDKMFAGAPGAIDYLNNVGEEIVRNHKYQVNYHISLAEYLLDGRIIVDQDKTIKLGLQRDFASFQDFMEGRLI